MTADEIKTLAKQIAPVVSGYVKDACQPLADRIADLEQRVAALDGQSRAAAPKRKGKSDA